MKCREEEGGTKPDLAKVVCNKKGLLRTVSYETNVTHRRVFFTVFISQFDG